ncbi:hypothetical protein A4X03_0g9338, partial [Tilletia caries]
VQQGLDFTEAVQRYSLAPSKALNPPGDLGEIRADAEGLDFLRKTALLQKAGSQGRLPAALAALQPIDELPGSANLPASPAVAIWDGQGQLAYFGPYSEGLTCSSSNSFIEPILEALAEGRKVDASNTLAVGCFCDWQ